MSLEFSSLLKCYFKIFSLTYLFGCTMFWTVILSLLAVVLDLVLTNLMYYCNPRENPIERILQVLTFKTLFTLHTSDM